MQIVLRRRLDYVRYLLGLRKSVHIFNNTHAPEQISILIPDSLGDIAINSSITQYFKSRFPGVKITLITHPKYLKAGYFDPNYDFLLEYPEHYQVFQPWELSYENQCKIAQEVTPHMDRLYLCQPSAWCDHLVPKFTMLDLQNHLCKIPGKDRFLPKLRIPEQYQKKAAQFRAGLKGPVFLIARQAYTATYNNRVCEYWRRLTEYCVHKGLTILDNSKEPAIKHERCLPVGEMPLPEIIALANLCDGAMALRSGLCDLVGFSTRCPQYVIHPCGFYPFSRTTFLAWSSLVKMGAEFVEEHENSFTEATDVEIELDRSREWLLSRLANHGL